MLQKNRESDYLELMNKCICGAISPSEFASVYSKTFSNDETIWNEDTYKILNGLFLDADEFIPSTDPIFPSVLNESPEFIIDESIFMQRIKDAIQQLQAGELK